MFKIVFKKIYLRTWAFSLLMGGTAAAWAQETGITAQNLLQVIMLTMIVMSVVALFLTFTIFTLVRARFARKAAVAEPQGQAEGVVAQTQKARNPWDWSWIKKKFITDAVPVAKEADIDLGHDYDGIRELDNNLPPWWKYGFYFSIGWAVVYLCVFHIFGDWSSEKEYKEEMAQAEVEMAEYLKTAANQVDESNVTLLTDADALANGKTIYNANCAPCHGMNGEGGIGPTFADQYWIHGGDIASVFKIIKYGVSEKGMIAWQDQLRPREIQEVSSYLMDFVGTNPPNQKEPQGDLYEPEEEEATQPAEEAAAEEAISMN